VKISLGVSPFIELVDIYHSRKATKSHDKIYALLGMCSDDEADSVLKPDYELFWPTLGNRLTVCASESREVAVIAGKGDIIGKVESVTYIEKQGGMFFDISAPSLSGYLTSERRNGENGDQLRIFQLVEGVHATTVQVGT
jgi:hypothetical protein